MIFDDLGPEWVARLDHILERREPKILGLLRAGAELSASERERIDDAIIDENVALMSPERRLTVESEAVRSLLAATRRLVPRRRSELPDRHAFEDGRRPPGDPYLDGGAESGYGPRPGTTGAIPPEQMPELHLLPEDYDIPDDPAASILGPAS